MTVDADLQKVLDLIKEANRPPYRDVSLEEARAGYQVLVNLFDTKSEKILQCEDRSIPGPAGDMPIRIYWPRKINKYKNNGLFIYLHGGDYVIGDLNTHDNLCRRLANRGDCLVASVDYRLAREHPFPKRGAMAVSRL